MSSGPALASAALVCAVLAVRRSRLGSCAGGFARRVGTDRPAGAGRARARHADEPAAGKGWDFGDEEEEETPSFAEDLRAQALDIALVVAFNVLAFVSFFRKSKPLKYVTFVASVAYIGFYKSTLMSIVNVFGLFGGNLPILRYNLAWYLLAAITLVSTVLWGRVYCGRICAFGALTQLLDAVVPARLRINVPRVLERRASFIKFGILAFALSYFVVTKDPLIYPYIEPFWMFGIYGRSAPMWIGLGHAARRHGVRPEPLLPVPVPARGVPRTHLAPDASSASSAGRSATTAASARRPASGARSRGRRSSRPNACAATTASGSTRTRRSARTT